MADPAYLAARPAYPAGLKAVFVDEFSSNTIE